MLNTIRRARGASTDREAGATLVEFALLFPVFMTLVLGMISAGVAYNQKLTMTAAAREASRYASTLPVTPACGSTGETGANADLKEWLKCVAAVAVQASADELPTTAPGREICVAYVKPAALTSTGANDLDRRLVLTTSNTAVSENGTCPSAPASSIAHRHVQVVMKRNSEIQALFFTYPVSLKATSMTRFERG
ncbi:MAG: pilus assembly protein [Actinomycetota bacterium]|nr:pilus assembly protein [Actinomycetota bacterium]